MTAHGGLALLAEYNHGIGVRELERESALMKLLRMDRLPDPDTIGDWLRRMGNPENGGQGYNGLGRMRDEINNRILRYDGIKEYTLDADATQVIPEKYDAKFTYKGVNGYMPMLGFLFESHVCLLDEFREGNVSPASDQLGFLSSV